MASSIWLVEWTRPAANQAVAELQRYAAASRGRRHVASTVACCLGGDISTRVAAGWVLSSWACGIGHIPAAARDVRSQRATRVQLGERSRLAVTLFALLARLILAEDPAGHRGRPSSPGDTSTLPDSEGEGGVGFVRRGCAATDYMPAPPGRGVRMRRGRRSPRGSRPTRLAVAAPAPGLGIVVEASPQPARFPLVGILLLGFRPLGKCCRPKGAEEFAPAGRELPRRSQYHRAPRHNDETG